MYARIYCRVYAILFLYLFVIHRSQTSTYYCGPSDNAFYRLLSQLLTAPCEQSFINFCCFQHDRCYDDCTATQLDCDMLFCDCLQKIQTNFYCRNIVLSLHCNFPQWFGKPYKCVPKESFVQSLRIQNESAEETINITVTDVDSGSL